MDLQRFFQPPEGSFFLFGPRGTGKSTWVCRLSDHPIYIDLLNPATFREFGSRPEHLIALVEGCREPTRVIIDEVQKVPELLSVVHLLIEQKQGHQFILTGSSARKLKREGVDLLAGRAINRAMHPFMGAELGSEFSLEEALRWGMLPLTLGDKNKAEVLRAYVDLYVMEEVKHEGLVRQIGGFARFLSTVAFSHGSLLNITNIARECEVKRSTVSNYLSILDDLLLATQLPPFTKRAQRILTSHPKFYLFDAGIYCTLKKSGPLDRVEETEGAALEGLVFQHLRAWSDYSVGYHELFYWRTKSGLEVDFIVYGERGFWAIEVKNNTRVFSSDVKGLLHFQKDYPECVPFLLYRGKERIRVNGILCLPCEEFLKGLHPKDLLLV